MPNPLETYTAHLTTIAVDPAALRLDSTGTLRPRDVDDSEAEADLNSLPSLDLGDEYELGDTLGSGGMGVVLRARHVPLGREVAVKMMHEGQGERTHARGSLLHEARVTGWLEHPNIVPVHALGRTPTGEPIFVMKRIEGVPWGELIRQPDGHDAVFEGSEPLMFHLGVLEKVCQAMAYAHDRGVVHRDLKPDNVMIGAFGEVYVLDWGIAGATRELPVPVPLVQSHGVIGTPAYMAPETAAGVVAGPPTDVYLLGAMLHEALTGEVLHKGATLLEQLASAFSGELPQYGPGVPPGLAQIAHHALAFEPEARPTAEQLRKEITRFIEERGALQIFEEAQEAAAEVRALLDTADIETIHARSSEVLFAYRLAAQQLQNDNEVRTAERDLRRAVDEALAAHTEELQALRRETSGSAGAWIASRTMYGEAAVFGIGGIVAHAIELAGYDIRGYWAGWFSVGVLATVAGVAAVWNARYPDEVTSRTRGMFYNLVFTSTMLAAWFAITQSRGMPIEESVAYVHMVAGGILGTLTTLMDVRATAGALVYILGTVLMLWWPEYIWLEVGFTNAVAFATMAWTWSRKITEEHTI